MWFQKQNRTIYSPSCWTAQVIIFSIIFNKMNILLSNIFILIFEDFTPFKLVNPATLQNQMTENRWQLRKLSMPNLPVIYQLLFNIGSLLSI